MNLAPPQGSTILVKTEGGDDVIVVPSAARSGTRFLFGLFLLFWLGIWTAGFRSAWSQIVAGSANSFIVFWLGAWTAGGAFAVYYLYSRVAASRSRNPEAPLDRRAARLRDSRFQMQFGYAGPREYWKNLFPKRTIVELSPQQLRSLRLRETDSGNRLTVDVEATRLEIAQDATEIEREWLYQLLSKRFC
jgi:hypothetical protein